MTPISDSDTERIKRCVVPDLESAPHSVSESKEIAS